MVKILHLSDLHLCHEDLHEPVKALQEAVTSQYKFDLDIQIADDRPLNAIASLAEEVQPDVFVVSGDITTFGDKKSYELAVDLFRRWGADGRCVVVPGNHDALAGQLAALLAWLENKQRDLSWWERWVARKLLRRFKLQQPLDALRACVNAAAPVLAEGSDKLDNYRWFVEQVAAAGQAGHPIRVDQTSRIFIHPFNTVSTNPVWMNSGQIMHREWDRLFRSIDAARSEAGTLQMVVIHHNPVSSPDAVESPIVYGYNGMPEGARYLRTAQEYGIDVVLHGHQHKSLRLLYDFTLDEQGHAYCLGVPSATSSESAGCAVISVPDINHLEVQRYTFPGHARFVTSGDPVHLPLERNAPIDPTTRTVRHEIKRYYPDEEVPASLWNEAFTSSCQEIFMSGRHFKNIRQQNSRRLEEFKTLLSSRPSFRLRILLCDPELLRQLGNVGEIWGRETLSDLAAEATKTHDVFEEFIENKLGKDERERIEVRLSHTVLPFACTVSDPNKPWGKMVLRLLPVGAFDHLDTPVMKLSRRDDQAFYEYYLKHLKCLFCSGKHILGGLDDVNGIALSGITD